MELHRTLLVFQLAGQAAAVPSDCVYKIVPMAELAQPPGLPGVLEGLLNLGGVPIPVLRLERLLGLPAAERHLFSALLILKDPVHPLLALLVDRVADVVRVPVSELTPLSPEKSLNGCATAVGRNSGRTFHILSVERILLEKERQVLSGFQAALQNRLEGWGARRP